MAEKRGRRPGSDKLGTLSERSKKLLDRFADYLLLERSMAKTSIASYRYDIALFCAFLEQTGAEPLTFTEDNVREFFASQGEMKAATQARRLGSLRNFVKFLNAEELREDNPLKGIENPKKERKLPMVLSEKTVEAYLNAPDITTPTGLRDKAMLELLYATGLRVSELVSLTFSEVHLDEQYLIKRGKGGKERMIPFGAHTKHWLVRYLNEARVKLDPQWKEKVIFVSQKGGALERISFWGIIKKYGRKIGLASLPSPHTFRHAFATHLLNHDADLRAVQLLLGHSALTTTQIYTHVANERMHQLFKKAHPRS